MLAADEYTKLPLRGFDLEEQQVVQRLLADDIILREEVAEQTLVNFGDTVISFTYDELRDFIIAYSLIADVSDISANVLEAALLQLPGRPIYEGVYKYAYLLARKEKKPLAIAALERDAAFIEHFSINIQLLPPRSQNDRDVERIIQIFSDTSVPRRVRRIVRFLLRRRNSNELLNASLLINHMNKLDDELHQTFIYTVFSNPSDYGTRGWREHVGTLVDDVWEGSSENGLGTYAPEWLAFFMHAASLARWSERERAVMLFRDSVSHESCRAALDLVRKAQANAVRSLIAEIEAPEDAES